MADLVPSVELKKADGSPLKVNFFFENGLPVKPLIKAPVKFWMEPNKDKYGIIITVENLQNINKFQLSEVSYHYTSAQSKDIWIHLEQCYFVIPKVLNNIVDKMKKNGLFISFVDINGTQL